MKIAIAPAPLLAVVSVVAGAAVAVALSLFSRPAEADPRMAEIRDTMVKARRLDSQPGGPGSLPLGAVCDVEPAKAAHVYKTTVSTAAGRHKLPASGLSVVQAGETAGELTALFVRWKGDGEYSAFINVLADLAAEKPTLFVEALDLKPRGSRAEFELKGKIWCWTPAANRS
jgi:hypothetical protein